MSLNVDVRRSQYITSSLTNNIDNLENVTNNLLSQSSKWTILGDEGNKLQASVEGLSKSFSDVQKEIKKFESEVLKAIADAREREEELAKQFRVM